MRTRNMSWVFRNVVLVEYLPDYKLAGRTVSRTGILKDDRYYGSRCRRTGVYILFKVAFPYICIDPRKTRASA